MHHKISGRKFNRRTSQRMALLNSLARSLLNYEKIITTLPKAKDICPYVEKMLTLGKHGKLSNRRHLFAKLRDDDLVSKVFGTLAERYKNRQGGYTRIIKCGFRKGDMAPIAVVELIDSDKDLSIAAPISEEAQSEPKIEAKVVEPVEEMKNASDESSDDSQEKPAKKTCSRKKNQ